MAFQQLKEYLSRPPIMFSPAADEVLYAYIVVAPHAVSLVLIPDDNGLQRLVYYMSKLLHEAEVRYLPSEKAILTVVHATRKLPHYFQAHTVVVLTQLPLKSILWTADYTERIALWNTILGAFDIKYMPRTSIQGQVHAMSLVLILDDNGLQRPVYYMSKLLHEAEIRYLPSEKGNTAVVHAT